MSPKLTDSAEKGDDQTIVFTQNVDCPKCGATFDVAFDTGAYDEDGLTDLEDLSAMAKCPNPDCGEEFEVEFSGWTNYGDAG